jgi:hypothetical protein
LLHQIRAVAQLVQFPRPRVDPDQPAPIGAADDRSQYPHLDRALIRHLRGVGDLLEEGYPEAARAALLRARAIEQELDQVAGRSTKVHLRAPDCEE